MDISVLIVDDFPLIRRGIASALRVDPAIRVVGEAGGAVQALEQARSLRPDVVLLDLRLSGDDGIELIERLRAEVEGLAILVVTAIEKIDTMRDAAAAGARGYLTKRISAGELRDAIVTVFGGGTVFDFSAAADLSSDYPQISPGKRATAQPLLTAREREVLAFVARGHTDKEVAERLSLSVRTVHSHLTAVRRKTGLRRRSELASWAIRHAFNEPLGERRLELGGQRGSRKPSRSPALKMTPP
jgi:DNA-binding NarL/FixJ family response regulator